MSKIENTTINVDQFYKAISLVDNELNYILTKAEDPFFLRRCKAVLFLDWSTEGRVKDNYKDPAVGLSLVMSPFNSHYTWLTTPITEILRQEEGLLEFKTENSHYILTGNGKDRTDV